MLAFLMILAASQFAAIWLLFRAIRRANSRTISFANTLAEEIISTQKMMPRAFRRKARRRSLLGLLA